MGKWNHRITLKHLLTRSEKVEDIRKSMAAIADVLKGDRWFVAFSTDKFYKIPECDDVILSSDYANKLIDRLYDFADSHRIWID